jgi:hypothetical protein
MANFRFSRALTGVLLLVFLAGCAAYAQRQYNVLYGEPQVQDRQISTLTNEPEFYRDVKPIVDKRCVVCHACYDAPCQLKMSAFEGIDRGVSAEQVYASRLLTTNPSRLFVDANNTQQWRNKGFYPALNERQQSPAANLDASTFYRMLALKRDHPLPADAILPESFDFSLSRKQQCAPIETFDLFEEKYPLWGMPYGLPAVSEEQFDTLERWLENGAPVTQRSPLSRSTKSQITQWETFLNGTTLKQQLVARYIYEHLFIANLYFPDVAGSKFFHLVRSRTPSGTPVDLIPSRRPYDDPGVDSFYYRIVEAKTTITAKTHMPYRLDSKRMSRWQQLFFERDYDVEQLPGYQVELASNPFATFEQLPVSARYRFMLDEAQFTISGFIKGPVCRGQIALSVINDNFWVLFVNPGEKNLNQVSDFLSDKLNLFQMPAEDDDATGAAVRWRKYSKMNKQYIQDREDKLNELYPNNENLTLDMVWDGDGDNANAALTIFRHFDSATVTKGLIGDVPKTAWIIGYPLLERIHYLLVSGFDIYGNTSHQLLTRLYMDFLRMEGESNFLSLMPPEFARKELKLWYRGAEDSVAQYLDSSLDRNDSETGIKFKTDQPKREFFNRVAQRLGTEVLPADKINRPIAPSDDPVLQAMQQLATLKGVTLSPLSEQSTLRVRLRSGQSRVFSILRNLSHSNVSDLLGEGKRLIPEEQTLTVVEGILGAYPNTFFDVDEVRLNDFVSQIKGMNGEADYRRLLDDYGVRRSNQQFWQYSDWLMDYYQREQPIQAGLLDYNRLDNR